MKYTSESLIKHFQKDINERKRDIQEDKKMMKKASPSTREHEKREIKEVKRDIKMHKKMIKELKGNKK